MDEQENVQESAQESAQESVPRKSITPERLRELMDMAPEEVKERAVELLDLSPEQKAIVAASAEARNLVRGEDLKHALAVMIAARQMYAVGYTELQRLLDHAEESRPLPELTRDVLVQSAMYTASKPFSEHKLMSSLATTVMPALAAIVDRHSEADEQTGRLDREEADRLRRARPVALPFRLDAEDEEPVLTREQSATLVGNLYACRLVRDLVLDRLARSRSATVLWLDDSDDTDRPEDASVVRVPASFWRGACNSGDAFARMLTRFAVKRAEAGRPLSAAIDLVLCGNLPALFTAGYKGRSPLAVAGDAHRRLWQWCRQAGAALLGFVPQVTAIDGPDPDLRDAALEQLRSFSRLRPLRLRRGVEDASVVRLLVGLGGFELATTVERLNAYSSLQLS